MNYLNTLHSLFHVFSLFIKGRSGNCQPLYFCPNALWKGILHAKNLHSKMQISVFLQRLSLEGTAHLYPWPHPEHLGLTTQKGVGEKGKLMPLLFGWKWEIWDPIAMGKWHMNPSQLCCRRHSLTEPACMGWPRGNEATSWMLPCVTGLSGLWGQELALPHLGAYNTH